MNQELVVTRLEMVAIRYLAQIIEKSEHYRMSPRTIAEMADRIEHIAQYALERGPSIVGRMEYLQRDCSCLLAVLERHGDGLRDSPGTFPTVDQVEALMQKIAEAIANLRSIQAGQEPKVTGPCNSGFPPPPGTDATPAEMKRYAEAAIARIFGDESDDSVPASGVASSGLQQLH